jgi:bacterial/archaeal transporter family protein
VGAAPATETPARPEEGSQGAPPAGGAWRWLAPSIGYVIILGLLGVTTKVALDDMRWSGLFIWVSIAYAVVAVTFVAGGARPRLSRNSIFAAVSGFFASLGLLLLFVALEQGDAGQVVPVTAAYPMVTAAVAAVVLRERMTPARVIGTLMVVLGVVVIGLD